MNDGRLTSAAHLRLALCSRLVQPRNAVDKPFGPAEFSNFERTVAAAGVSDPGELMARTASEIAQALSIQLPAAERVTNLLARSAQIAIEVERLSARGIWVITRGDIGYPQRWLDLLQHRAPVVIYGAGDKRLLMSRGVAVVGSRDVTEHGAQFARRTGAACATAELAVISGAARGVDQQAMSGALENGGIAVGVLAGALADTAREPENRRWLEDNHLALVTQFVPSAPFLPTSAMARNELVYTLAEAAIVVASDISGGTWEGAQKNMKHRWVPIFVRADQPLSPGNKALLDRGAHPMRSINLTPEFLGATRHAELPPQPRQTPAQSALAFE